MYNSYISHKVYDISRNNNTTERGMEGRLIKGGYTYIFIYIYIYIYITYSQRRYYGVYRTKYDLSALKKFYVGTPPSVE